MKTDIRLDQLQTIQAGFDAAPGSTARIRGEAMLKGLIGQVERASNHAQSSWNYNCAMFGGKPEHFGQIVTVRNERFEIVGINGGAWKYPIKGKRLSDGREFRLPA